MEARAFSPGHISTFFVPRGGPRTAPERRGSLGSGFCVEAGVSTSVSASGTSARDFDLRVFDNGRRPGATGLTETVIEGLLARAGVATGGPRRIAVRNRFALPLGSGFGVSGALALGAALAGNEALDLGLSRAECVEAAHVAEVLHLTGLGDVAGQSVGGFEIRTKAGPPPRGTLLRPPTRAEGVALVSFGPRSTHGFLSKAGYTARVARAGTRCLRDLRRTPTLAESARLGRRFTDELGLASPRARRLLAALPEGAPASLAQLGDSVFAVGGRAVARAAQGAAGPAFFLKTRVSTQGARLA